MWIRATNSGPPTNVSEPKAWSGLQSKGQNVQVPNHREPEQCLMIRCGKSSERNSQTHDYLD